MNRKINVNIMKIQRRILVGIHWKKIRQIRATRIRWNDKNLWIISEVYNVNSSILQYMIEISLNYIFSLAKYCFLYKN